MRTVIITGGNSGLGRKTAEKIARNGEYRVILACRNAEKAKRALGVKQSALRFGMIWTEGKRI